MFLPSESGIGKEVQDADRDYNNMVTTQPSVERGSPHIWFFNAMLKAIAETLVDRLNLSPSDRGKVEALRSLGKITEEGKFSNLGEWIKSCRHLLTYARPGQSPKTRIILATDGCITYKWKNQEADPGYVSYSPLEEALGTQDGFQKKNDQGLGPGQALTDTTRGASSARETSAREPGERAQQSFSPEKGKGNAKGMHQLSQILNGPSLMNLLAQRLTRDRHRRR